MDGWPFKVLENKDHIKVLETKLDTLQMGQFDFAECDNKEGRVGEVDETVRGRLEQDIRSEGHTREAEFSEGNIHLYAIIALWRMISPYYLSHPY